MARRYRKYVNENDINEEGSTDVGCPHCAMLYKTHMYKVASSRVSQMRLELVSAKPEYYDDASLVSENIYKCASCKRLFVLNLMNFKTRPLNYLEQRQFNKYKGMTRNKKLTFNHLEAAYLGLEQFSTIHVTQFNAETGELYFMDAFGNECRVELMPMILKSFIVDSSADDKVKDAIMQAIKMKKLDDSSYNKHSQKVLQEDFIQTAECEKMDVWDKSIHSHKSPQYHHHARAKAHHKDCAEHSHQRERH